MQEYRNRIRELREEKHITQVRLSTELGVAQETISAYEQGRHLPSVTSLMKLSVILDASMDYIMMKSDVRNVVQVKSLSDNETRLLRYYKKLNTSGKEKALSYARWYLYSLQYHLVWCTNYRKQLLKNGIDAECKKMMYKLAEASVEFIVLCSYRK